VSAAELHALVARLAAEPELWRPHVHHVADQRTYELLVHDEDVMAWVISWMDDHDTGFHDHDVSAGAVHVVQGAIREERLRVGREPLVRTFGPGTTFDFSSADIHRVAHAGGGPAVTLHAYSPPLWRMGAYEVEADGSLRRHSISYAEELRPLAAQAA
jgi:predicted metal-dependent enzyme (double-stranded beta helix superfamily)